MTPPATIIREVCCLRTFYIFNAAITLRHKVRDFLEECKVHKMEIKCVEADRSSTMMWLIEGEEVDIRKIAEVLEQYAKLVEKVVECE